MSWFLRVLCEKGVERMRRIGNANLPLTHRNNADESITGMGVAIVALPHLAIRDRLIARLEYIGLKEGGVPADDLGDDVGNLCDAVFKAGYTRTSAEIP
jgi:hypothetical protein